jgi:hypothetical protein
MGGIVRLAKSDENKHSSYMFASIDDFYDLTRPLCDQAGLIILADEESVDFRTTGGGDRARTWLVVKYSFTLIVVETFEDDDARASSAVTWGRTPHRTIMVDASMGSQAFGAAQSYAVKTFMRSLFQISTGDVEDLDTQGRGTLPATQTYREPDDFPGDRPRPTGRPVNTQPDNQGSARKSSAQAKRDGDWDKLMKGIKVQRNEEELSAWASANAGLIESLPNKWKIELREVYRDRMAILQEMGMRQMEGAERDPGEEDDPPPPGGYGAHSGR